MLLEYERLLSLAHRKDRRGMMNDSTVSATATNASCGDECTVWLKVADEKIVDISFEAKGCVISQASAAVLVEMMVGNDGTTTFANISANKQDLLERVGTMTGQELPIYSNLSMSPLRERCLTTPLKALQDVIFKL